MSLVAAYTWSTPRFMLFPVFLKNYIKCQGYPLIQVQVNYYKESSYQSVELHDTVDAEKVLCWFLEGKTS